jgi:hypothetical protein
MFLHRQRFLLILALLLFTFSTVAAQTADSAFLSPPDVSGFPTIRAYLKVFDTNGDFIQDLQPEDITIVEDSRSIPVEGFQKQDQGAQFVIALNQGSSLAIRDSNGISRFDTLRESLIGWAENHSASQDDLSFVTNGGVETLHQDSGTAWLQEFQSFETDFRAAVPSLDVLIRAVEIASESPQRAGMGRSILLLTPPPELPTTGTVQSILSLAKNENIRVNVWMVSSPEAFTSLGAEQLAELAAQTGGVFFAFSGTEAIPEIEPYLEQQRYVYTLSYESGIRNSDPHQISARINVEGRQIESETQNFELQVLPPNPIFISPPLEIIRADIASLSDTLSEITAYTPTIQTLEVLIEFPDGRPRPLQRSALYVDGEIVDEKTQAPFETFTWNLVPYKNSGSHVLQVEAEDVLGLRSTSIEQTIQITVKQTPQRVLFTLVDNAPVIAGAAAALAGGILLLVLVVRGHIRPRTFGARRKKRNKKEELQPIQNGAQSEPSTIRRAPSRRRFSNWVNQISRSQQESRSARLPQSSNLIAYLEYLEQDQASLEPIAVKIGETTFGKDPTKATYVLNDNAVCDLHARLVVNQEKIALLFDEGSIAGTWLNFAPVSAGGQQVRHGDIIHIGRIALCYKITDKEAIPKPVVRPLEPSP